MTPFWAAYLTTLAFFFGACVGSFLNVCIYRIPLDESVVRPRSHCPKCGKMIAWYDNIPMLSYVALRAKCRHCGLHIPFRYFLVEALTSALFLAVWFRYGLTVQTPVFWLVISGLILGTFVDFDHMIIPDRVSLGGMVAGLICSTVAPSLHGESIWYLGTLDSLIGLVVGSGSLWTVGFLGKLAFKKDAMGMGDVKLLGGLGAFLGWQSILFIIMVSSLIGSVVGVYFIVAKSKEWQSRIPYGPYIALAAVVWILGGNMGWQMYVRWLSGE
jgi:leader peptidase (prepilin peptidase)/N-methyltransferase